MRRSWILLSQRPRAALALRGTRLAGTLEEAMGLLRDWPVRGLWVDESFGGGPAGAWRAAFAVREAFPSLPVAVIKQAQLDQGGR